MLADFQRSARVSVGILAGIDLAGPGVADPKDACNQEVLEALLMKKYARVCQRNPSKAIVWVRAS